MTYFIMLKTFNDIDSPNMCLVDFIHTCYVVEAYSWVVCLSPLSPQEPSRWELIPITRRLSIHLNIRFHALMGRFQLELF